MIRSMLGTVTAQAVGEQCSVRDLGLQDCSTTRSGDGIFDPRNPTGHYKFELSDAFEVERFKKLQVPFGDENKRVCELAMLYNRSMCCPAISECVDK